MFLSQYETTLDPSLLATVTLESMEPGTEEETEERSHIADYPQDEQANLAFMGFHEYTITSDRRVWCDKAGKWIKPMCRADGYVSTSVELRRVNKCVEGRTVINVNKVTSKLFVEPALVAAGAKYCADGTFLVTSNGNVFDTNIGRMRVPSRGGRYLHLPLHAKYWNVHRLVAENFVPNPDPEKYDTVNHKNFNRHDNRAENLEWCTQSENLEYTRNADTVLAAQGRPTTEDPEYAGSEYACGIRKPGDFVNNPKVRFVADLPKRPKRKRGKSSD